MDYSERWITKTLAVTIARLWLARLQSLFLIFFVVAALGGAVNLGEGNAKARKIFIVYSIGSFGVSFSCGLGRFLLVRRRFAPPWNRGADKESHIGAVGAGQ